MTPVKPTSHWFNILDCVSLNSILKPQKLSTLQKPRDHGGLSASNFRFYHRSIVCNLDFQIKIRLEDYTFNTYPNVAYST